MPQRSNIITILVLTVLAALLGYNYFFQPFQRQQEDMLIEESAPVDALTSQTQQLLDSLTARQKVMQLLAVPLDLSVAKATPAAQMRQLIAAETPGMVTLFGTAIPRATAETEIAAIKAPTATGGKIWVAVDHEGGTVQRLSGEGFTSLPSWQSLCSQSATASAQLVSTSARELASAGVDMVLAPVVDIANQNNVLRSRVCSSNGLLVAERTADFVAAMQQQKITPVLKHFPGIGKTTRDLHTSFDRVEVQTVDAVFYRQLLTQLPNVAVMVSHVGVTNQYPDIPCSLSTACVGELKVNFPETLIITDALDMASARFSPDSAQPLSLPFVTYEAIKSGNDIALFGPTLTAPEIEEIAVYLAQKYESDPVFKERVNKSLEKIIRLKQ